MNETKALRGLEIKDADQGLVQAVFATLDVIDLDGDVTVKGAFTDGAPVRISAYGHASWGNALPVGKGVIRANEKEAVLDGRFFLDTTAGRDTFATVKEMGDLQQWSYGYDVVESSDGELEGRPVRYLRSLDVHEVSPVMLGAGIDTRTLGVKSGKQLDSDLRQELESGGRARFGSPATPAKIDDFDVDESWVVYSVTDRATTEVQYVKVSYTRAADGSVTLGNDDAEVDRTTVYEPKSSSTIPFSKEADTVLGDVSALITRAKAFGSQSTDAARKEGRVLSAANRERLAGLLASMGEAAAALDELLAESDPAKQAADVSREFLRYQRSLAQLPGGTR